MKMTEEQKESVRVALERYVNSCGSLRKASANLTNVSSATLSDIINSKWERISDAMLWKIASQVGGVVNAEEQLAPVATSVFTDLQFVMDNTRAEKACQWVVSPAGSGKTMTAKHHQLNNSNTYYVLCDEDMRKKEFAMQLAQAVGLPVNRQLNARSIILTVVEHVRKQPNVLIIFDEADKLSDNILNYFIAIYNNFEDALGRLTIGILFLSTDYISTRMERGLRFSKKGYLELWSRINQKFYMTDANTVNDVEAICRAKGLNNQKAINAVIEDAEAAELDIRRVVRKIGAELNKSKQAV